MKNLCKYFFKITLMLIPLLLLLQQHVVAQGPAVAIINGNTATCVGQTEVYTTNINNPAYTYIWNIGPNNMGILTASNNTATIHWTNVGSVDILVVIKDPQNGNVVIYEGELTVEIGALPNPWISSNVQLACQLLNQDSLPANVDSFLQLQPVFDSANCQLVCANSIVEYYANGEAGSTFTWSVTGANSFTPGSGDTCFVTWAGVGFGEVRVIETTANGCIKETVICVEIIEKPAAKFQTVPGTLPTPIVICINGELVLQDMSVGSLNAPIVSYLWNWGDGNQTIMSPGAANSTVSHKYTLPGIYEVSLTVVNSCGCADVYVQSVEVIEEEAPVIACPRVVCEDETAVYSIDPKFSCDPTNWDVIGGYIDSVNATSVKIKWNNVDPNVGFGYVLYKGCAPCEMTVVEEVPVVLFNGAIQGPAVICADQQYIYRMPKWPATEFEWFVSAGAATLLPTGQRNEMTLIPGAGAASITLTVRYRNTVLGCEGSADLDILVMPQATIQGPIALCENSIGTYTLLGGSFGNWTLETALGTLVATGFGPAFSHNFTAPGNYRLKVLGTNFCPPEDYMINIVATPQVPDSIFGLDRACPNIPLKYDAGGIINGTTFTWNVNGGGTTAAAIGDFSYITFATLPAMVSAARITTDGLGCLSPEITFLVDVAVPTLSISGPINVCHSSITNYSLNYDEADNYEWSLANPLLGSVLSGGTTKNVAIQWNIPLGASQTTWLRVKVGKCATLRYDSIAVTVQGFPDITAVTLSKDTICSGEAVTLTATTSLPIVTASYEVHWGDGNTSNGLTHVYQTSGAATNMAFTPVLTLSNMNGCAGAVTASAPIVVVKPAPVGVLSPYGSISHCGVFPAETLSVTITTGLSGTNSFDWVVPFGAINPGNVAVNANADVYGSYYAIVTNSITGCSNPTNNVVISEECSGGPGGPNCGPAPTVTLSADTADCGAIVVDAIVGTGATGHSWSVPSGVTINGSNANNLVATAAAGGIYTIKYTVYYAPNDCEYTYNVNVFVPYVASLKHSITCDQPNAGYMVTLFDHSTTFPTAPLNVRDYYEWPSMNFLGSGNSVDVFQAAGTSKTYVIEIKSGTFPICYDYATITTPDFPAVNVFIDPSNPFMPGCVDDVTFKLGHTITAGTIQSYMWDFDDGTSNASNVNPIGKVYSVIGLRFPSLTITDIYGCLATDDVNVDVLPNQISGDLISNPNPACQGTPVNLQFNSLGFSMPNQFAWYQQNDLIGTSPTNTYSVYEPGAYWVQSTDQYGCRHISNQEAVHIVQVPPVSIFGKKEVCIDQPFVLQTQDYGPGYSYEWSGYATGTGSSLSQTLNTPGTYTYYVTITESLSGMNCSRISEAFEVVVSNPPDTPIISYSITSCQPYEVMLTATGPAGWYTWSNGMSGTTIQTPFGGDYQVTVIADNGCKMSNSKKVPHSLEEFLWVFPTGCFCNSTLAPKLIGPIIPFSKWIWGKDGTDDLVGTYSYMQDYYPAAGHTYTMTIADENCNVQIGSMFFGTDTCDALPIWQAPNIGSIQINGNNLNLAPNPAIDQVVCKYTLAMELKDASIVVLDATNRILQQQPLVEPIGNVVLDINSYASGLYYVALLNNGQVVQIQKLVIAH